MRLHLAAATLGAGFLAFAALPAQAAPFGPATGSIAFTYSPTVTVTPPTGTGTFNGGALIFSGTGSLFNTTTGTGSSAGTLNFSTTIGATVTDVVTNFLTFADTTGGQFLFSAGSVTTQSYVSNPGVSSSISLYVLGTMGDSNLNLDATPTSVTITLNQTGTSAYSASATLSNPPAPVPPAATVPEPATLTLLGAGLLGLGLTRRRRS